MRPQRAFSNMTQDYKIRCGCARVYSWTLPCPVDFITLQNTVDMESRCRCGQYLRAGEIITDELRMRGA